MNLDYSHVSNLSQAERLGLYGPCADMDCDNDPLVTIDAPARFQLPRAALRGGVGPIISNHRPICQGNDLPDLDEELPEAIALRMARMDAPLPGYVLPSMRSRGYVMDTLKGMGCGWNE